MITGWDIGTWLWITASLFTISDILKNWIFEYLEKNSPIVKELKTSIWEIVDKWSEDCIDELKNKLHDFVTTSWLPCEVEEKVFEIWNDDNLFPKEFWIFVVRSKEKAEWLLYLFKKQIEWYEKNLDLSKQMEDQKISLLEQFSKDADNFIKTMHDLIRNTYILNPSFDLEKFEEWKNTRYELKDFCIKKCSLLIELIIKKISV